MLLFRISQVTNDEFDVWTAAVVAADSIEAARNMHPASPAGRPDMIIWSKEKNGWMYSDEIDDPEAYPVDDWAPPHTINVTMVGVCVGKFKPGVILASYRAG